MTHSAQTKVTPTQRIFLHVGVGLEHYTFGKSPTKAKQDVETMMCQAAQAHTGLSDHRAQAFPEFMSTERKAALFLFSDFSSLANDATTTFCVATFSRAVFEACLHGFSRLGYADQVLVCRHRDEVASFAEHSLDERGMLTDWPSSVLDANLMTSDLMELGFKIPR